MRKIEVRQESNDKLLYVGWHRSYNEASRAYRESKNYRIGLTVYVRNATQQG